MGQAKEHWMRQQDEGWTSVGSKWICASCIQEKAVGDYIMRIATSKTCSYCGSTSSTDQAAEMDEVLSFIAQGFQREWEDPVESVSYCSAEGGYLYPLTEPEELIAMYGFDDCPTAVYDDLQRAFAHTQWVPIDPYSMRRDEEMVYAWDAFSKQVCHQTRFVFFRTTTDFGDPCAGEAFAEPHQVLESLSFLCKELGLVVELASGAKIIRARRHPPTVTPRTVDEIAPLPPGRALKQNRFSPAGIPMFYGAEDDSTAFVEVILPEDPETDHVTFGEFVASRNLMILDLTKLPEMPSVFDEDLWDRRAPISFLQHFIQAARKPVDPEETSIAYVPTQVVAEYFRHLFRIDGEQKLDGLRYQSCHEGAGGCFTLFFGAEECGEVAEEGKALVLSSIRTTTVLKERCRLNLRRASIPIVQPPLLR